MQRFYAVLYSAVRFLDIRTLVREMRETVRAYFADWSIGELPADTTDEAITARLTVRMGICLAGSEMVGTYCIAIIGSFWGQYSSGGSWFWGTIGGIGGDLGGGVLGFDVLWALLNLRYYLERRFPRIGRFLLDVCYLHACAIVVAVPLYCAEFLICWLMVTLIGMSSEEIANAIPVMSWFGMTNSLLEPVFLIAAAGFAPDSAKHILPRYRGYLQRNYAPAA